MGNLGRKINESFDKYLEKIGATTLTEAANSPVSDADISNRRYTDKDKQAVKNSMNDRLFETAVRIVQKELFKKGLKKYASEEDVIRKVLSSIDMNSTSAEQVVDMVIDQVKNKNGVNESYLNEAVPRDLMGQIKRTGNYRQRDKDILLGNDYVTMDYQSADMREITADDVLQMRKNKEPLDDIYILKNGRMIKLMGGKPAMYDGNDYTAKSNQSLKKSLEGADKIYIGKISPFSETNPEEYKLRKSQFETRKHMKISDDDRQYAKQRNKYADHLGDDTYDGDTYNTVKRDAQILRNRAANARYYDSNDTNRVPDFKGLKRAEKFAKTGSANTAQKIKELKAHKKQSDAKAKQSRDEINKMLRK